MKPIYQIQEYGSFITGRDIGGYVTLPQQIFAKLEQFVLNNRCDDTFEFMRLSTKKGIGKVITVRNYVGIIVLNDGTSIEILPKITYSDMSDDYIIKTKKLLLDMLKTLDNYPYKSFQTANISCDKINILDIFIRMFIDEVFYIVKRGLKCNYELIEENATFLKGKIKFSEHIKYNHTHKEKNYIQYDVFSVNRPENRILKTTLIYLYKHSKSTKNKTDIKILLNSFDEVPKCIDVNSDFEKCILNRNTKDYNNALIWSKIFMMGKSFTSFTGSEVAIALLFPMEVLFEKYIAFLMKKYINKTRYCISVQDKSFYLFDKPSKKFSIRPDLVIKCQFNNKVYVMDTKWKILSSDKANYGISQSDMYQMYVYQKKYNAEYVTLIYPRTDKLSEKIQFEALDGIDVRVEFIDLFNAKNCIKSLIDEI